MSQLIVVNWHTSELLCPYLTSRLAKARHTGCQHSSQRCLHNTHAWRRNLEQAFAAKKTQ